MNKHSKWAGVLWVSLMVCSGCGTGRSIGSVKEYVVEVTEEIGEGIKSKARTLSEALRRIWKSVFPDWEGKVRVDADNPLRGTLEGAYRIQVVIVSPEGRRDKIALKFTNPRMCRESENAPFELCPSNYPASIRNQLEE